jgi:hypothetical protein
MGPMFFLIKDDEAGFGEVLCNKTGHELDRLASERLKSVAEIDGFMVYGD